MIYLGICKEREFKIKQIDRLWREKVDEMRTRANEIKSWKIYELEEMIEYYTEEVKKLKANKNLKD